MTKSFNRPAGPTPLVPKHIASQGYSGLYEIFRNSLGTQSTFMHPMSCLAIPDSQLEYSQCREVIDFVLKNAESHDRHMSDYGVWDSYSVRHLDIQTIPSQYRQFPLSRLEFLFRHNQDVQWIWRQSEFAWKVREICQPFLDLFSHVTRVKINIQKRNKALPLHRSLTIGQKYDLRNPFQSEPGSERLIFRMYDWVQDDILPAYQEGALENYYAFKIPLTLKPTEYGIHTMIESGREWRYETNGNAYFLNESNLHSSPAVNFERGLIFVDGIVDFLALNARKLELVERLPLKSNQQEFD